MSVFGPKQHCMNIFSSKQNHLHNEANCKVEFVIENLKSLEQELSKINIPLTVLLQGRK